MPTYILHGFRWPRPLIRIHIILQNLDDCAAEWICSRSSTSSLLENFHDLFPAAMPHLSALRFIEQYDPNDLSASSLSQPYAYVADVVEEVKLGMDIDEVRGRGVGQEQWGALMEIRDRLAPDEKVGWWVVVCGDEERWAPKEGLARGGGTPLMGHTGFANGYGKAKEIAYDDNNNGLGIAGVERTRAENERVVHVGADRDPERERERERRDQGLRDLREQVGYRTESDASEYSSGGVTRYNTSGTSHAYQQQHRTPDTSAEPPSDPPSPKKSGVRKWLSKRKSARSIKELAKAQTSETPPPMPKSPARGLGQSPAQNGMSPAQSSKSPGQNRRLPRR